MKYFMLVLISLLIYSCSNEENPVESEKNSIIGRWERIKETKIDSTGTTIRNSDSQGWDLILMTYYDDNTWIQGGAVNRSGTWEINADSLYLTYFTFNNYPNNVMKVFFKISSNMLKTTGVFTDWKIILQHISLIGKD